jgi:hemoglobin/transferrin/lactoferrin receptor protein
MHDMKYIIIVFVCFLATINASAQQIKVIHQITGEAISGVAIYNQNQTKSTTTNLDGDAILDAFENSERIYFRHISFNINSKLKSKLKSITLANYQTNLINHKI